MNQISGPAGELNQRSCRTGTLTRQVGIGIRTASVGNPDGFAVAINVDGIKGSPSPSLREFCPRCDGLVRVGQVVGGLNFVLSGRYAPQSVSAATTENIIKDDRFACGMGAPQFFTKSHCRAKKCRRAVLAS